jgi:ABC-2 type transport system permease protein
MSPSTSVRPGETGLASGAPPAPLGLLVRVNALTLWRRLMSIREQSRLLTAIICLFIAGYLVLAFKLFHLGLKFVGRFPGLGTLLAERLLFLLFALLFVLLLLSNLIISYSNLFRNRETAFLLSLPVARDTIFQWKFIESTLLASWAFLFLIAPLLGAYGITRGVAWHFYAAAPLLVACFIVLPAVVGAFAAVQVARYLDRRVFQVTALSAVAGLLVLAGWWFRPGQFAGDATETRVQAVMDRLLFKTAFVEHPLLPSCWLARSVLHWSEGALVAAAFFGLVILSYALFFGLLAFTRMGGRFYEAASAVQSRGSAFARWRWFRLRSRRREERRYPVGLTERGVSLLRWLGPDVRALVVKDLRMFWRDTTQWAQSLMLFGLLGVYIFNLRHFSQQINNPFWVHLVSYLNLGACSLNLATLTTRFVFPQFSLEGKRLWIVGLAPLGLARLVWIKYWLASGVSLAVTLGLMMMSCHMLELGVDRMVHFTVASSVMTLTLNGLAVGLGVLYPNFKEDNPSKIVSGFGGTFCLVLSFLYILGSVVVLAFAASWPLGGAEDGFRSQALLLLFLALSYLLGWLPMKLAVQRLKTFEV